jgi:tetratricopeptide (TPR) repeat protein
MKLSCRFLPQQLLFLSLAALIFPAIAQAQDRIVTKDGRTQDVKIMGVSSGTVQVKIGAGSIGIPLATIAQVTMAPPAEFTAAVKAFEEKNYTKALVNAKTVSDKFKGLPVDWARQATSLLGDTYAALNDIPRAEAAYREYQKLYPGAGSIQTDIGLAKIALLKKDYATAKQKLQPIVDAALKDPAKTGGAYGQAFFLLGQIHEAEGDKPAALENYLRTVTLFAEDRLAAASAQERADALRKADPALAVP